MFRPAQAGLNIERSRGKTVAHPVHKPIKVSAEARELHKKSLVVDLHTDSFMAVRLLRLDYARRNEPPDGMQPWKLHTDVPRLREGGVDAVFYGIVTHPIPLGAYGRALRNIHFARREFEKTGVSFCTSPDQILAARERGAVAGLLGLEGFHMLEGRVERLADLYRLGVRYAGMTHFTSNAFAVSSASKLRKHGRLNARGYEALEACESLGMMVDLAHVHTDIINEVCIRATKPVIVSHGATYAVRPIFRNLTDRDIRSVASTGGVIGLFYKAEWIAPEGQPATLATVVDHADHIKRLVGARHIALGSDWDGLIATPAGMRGAEDLPALTQIYLQRGYSPEEVTGILGGNFMRAFKDATD
jgi:membrane dipeptidase